MLITTDYPPDTGGVAWYYGNLVEKLNTTSSHTSPPIFGGGAVHVLKLGTWAMTRWWPFMIFPLLNSTLLSRPYSWWVGQVLPVGTVVWLLSFVWRKPYIVSTHGMDVLLPLQSLRKRWLVGKILSRAYLITANSKWTKEEIIRNYESGITNQELRKKIEVVYPIPKPKREVPPDEVHALRKKLNIADEAKVLLTVARLVKRKGIDRVITALPELWKKLPNVYYIVVGEGEERGALQHHTHTILTPLSHGREIVGHENQVILAGRARDEELPAYYAMADLFIQLPRSLDGDVEGFGIVYLEANQYELPIVATASGGTREALTLCKQVTLIGNPDDSSEVSAAILHALSNQ